MAWYEDSIELFPIFQRIDLEAFDKHSAYWSCFFHHGDLRSTLVARLCRVNVLSLKYPGDSQPHQS